MHQRASKFPVSGSQRIQQNFRLIRVLLSGYILFTAIVSASIATVLLDYETLYSAIIVGTAALITVHYLFRPGVADRYPVSALQIFTFCLATQLIPLGGTMIEGKLLTYNLDLPTITFSWIVVAQITFVISHILYRHIGLFRGTKTFLSNELGRLGLFQIPSHKQLWMFAVIGIIPFFVAGFLSSFGAGFVVKILQGMGYFAYAPFVIPFYHLIYPSQPKSTRRQNIQVGLYFGFILLIAMAINSRGGIGSALMTVGFGLIIVVMLGTVALSKISRRQYVSITVVFLVILFPISYLALAIQVAREHRGSSSQIEMVFQTLETIAEPSRVYASLKFQNAEGKRFGWDEEYLSNVFLNRFAVVKSHDLSFRMIKDFGDIQKEQLRTYTKNRILAILPTPVLKFFGISLNKNELISFSLGDYLFFLKMSTYQDFYGFGAMKFGSQLAHGRAMFGPYAYVLVLGICAVFTFAFFDSFTLGSAKTSPTIPTKLSPLVLFSVVAMGRFLNEETMVEYATLVFRGYLQFIVLYLIVFHITRTFAPSKQIPGRLSPKFS
jgi:hypothetical protein